MNYITAVKTILSLIPLLIKAISIAEDALPGQGKGEQKLSMVRQILETGLDIGEDIDKSIFPKLWGVLARITSSIISNRK